jgi:hypothetical protein
MKKLASLAFGVSMIALAAVAPAKAWDSHHHQGGNNNPPQVTLPQIDLVVAYNKNSDVKVTGTITGASGGLNNNGDGSNIGVTGIGAAASKSDTYNGVASSFTPCTCTSTADVGVLAINKGSPVTVAGTINTAGNNNGTGSSIGVTGVGASAGITTTVNVAAATPAPSGGNPGGNGGNGGWPH